MDLTYCTFFYFTWGLLGKRDSELNGKIFLRVQSGRFLQGSGLLAPVTRRCVSVGAWLTIAVWTWSCTNLVLARMEECASGKTWLYCRTKKVLSVTNFMVKCYQNGPLCFSVTSWLLLLFLPNLTLKYFFCNTEELFFSVATLQDFKCVSVILLCSVLHFQIQWYSVTLLFQCYWNSNIWPIRPN